MIKNGSEVTLHYALKVEGQVVDRSNQEEPLTYVHGQGQLIEGIEEALEGMSPGEKKEFTVSPEKGYGEVDPNGIQDVPKEAFDGLESVDVGDVVAGQSGDRPFQARVVEIGDEQIKIDLNHPLAGKTLEFAVEVVEVAEE